MPTDIARDSVISHSADLGKGGLYARFEELGHVITHTREEVSARMPTPEEVAGLSLPDGVPIIEVVHTGVNQYGEPFEVTTFVMRADHMGLDYAMPVAD